MITANIDTSEKPQTSLVLRASRENEFSKLMASILLAIIGFGSGATVSKKQR